MDIITAKELHLFYGSFEALKGINIGIPEKEITALIGPSGCGKSTFLKTINRMNDLVQGVSITGQMLYREQDIYAKDTDVTMLRKNIGMVFQKPNPFPMSIYDNVAYGPRLHGNHKKSELDDLVQHSLEGAALWGEVKDRLKKAPWASLAASSSVCASPGPWRWSRRCCSWMSRQAPWTRPLP